jgi:hypothetical protein
MTKISVELLRAKFPVEKFTLYGECIVVPGIEFDPDWEVILVDQGYKCVNTDVDGVQVTLVRLKKPAAEGEKVVFKPPAGSSREQGRFVRKGLVTAASVGEFRKEIEQESGLRRVLKARWVDCSSGDYRHEWNVETGKNLYQEEHVSQKNLSGETEERVSHTLRCVHTVEELRAVFVERLKELVPKVDEISSLKVSGVFEDSEFSIDLTSYGKSVAISLHHGHTWTGFRAEEHEYKSGEKSAVHVNDPEELDMIREFIDAAFEGKLGIPIEKVSLKKKHSPAEMAIHNLHSGPEESLEADKIETTDNPEESLGAEEVRG